MRIEVAQGEIRINDAWLIQQSLGCVVIECALCHDQPVHADDLRLQAEPAGIVAVLCTAHPMIYFLSFVCAFLSVGLKGFQHKNVIHNRYIATAITSYLMAVFDVVSVGLIVRSGWTIVFSTGTGAALGMVCAMAAHNRFFGRPT